MSTSIDPATGKPKKPGLINVYTMLLVVSLLAMIVACLLLLVEFGRYGYQMKPDPSLLRVTTPSAPPAEVAPSSDVSPPNENPPAMNNEAPPQNPAPPADGAAPAVPPPGETPAAVPAPPGEAPPAAVPPATTPDPNNM